MAATKDVPTEARDHPEDSNKSNLLKEIRETKEVPNPEDNSNLPKETRETKEVPNPEDNKNLKTTPVEINNLEKMSSVFLMIVSLKTAPAEINNLEKMTSVVTVKMKSGFLQINLDRDRKTKEEGEGNICDFTEMRRILL